ncbi:uncharacterized protein L201_000131 [Kwoniella dendrophila CBS 6074]|uniref:cGMP-dependent protein kinase interacting domain-containing protein n=1 Tax=Kwoniella dendrophila CBS 6074 TaxID=1295534 RepID=A0AAX4JKI0_9TREE
MHLADLQSNKIGYFDKGFTRPSSKNPPKRPLSPSSLSSRSSSTHFNKRKSNIRHSTANLDSTISSLGQSTLYSNYKAQQAQQQLHSLKLRYSELERENEYLREKRDEDRKARQSAENDAKVSRESARRLRAENDKLATKNRELIIELSKQKRTSENESSQEENKTEEIMKLQVELEETQGKLTESEQKHKSDLAILDNHHNKEIKGYLKRIVGLHNRLD